MASSYSDRLRLEKQGAGENANTWGDRLNQNVIDLVDVAVAGVTAVDVTGAGSTGITLSENNGSDDTGRHAGLRFTGSLTADVTVSYTAGGDSEKIYFVNNESTGGHKVIMDNGDTKVSVGNQSALIATQGSNSYTIRDFESGTRMLFEQDSAPEGWSVVTDSAHNNAALRIVNAATSGGDTGGSNDFTSVFNTGITVSITGKYTESTALNGTTSITRLTRYQIPPHNHTINHKYVADRDDDENKNTIIQGGSTTTSNGNVGENGNGTGNAAGHSHSLANKSPHTHKVSIAQTNAFNLNVKYVNFIVCEKD